MQSHYEFEGEKYRLASKHQREWGETMLRKMRLKGNESVLDLGCGDGTLSRIIAQHVPDGGVLGVDASSGMIRAAKPLENENLSFQELDINQLDFDEQFDIIFSNAALHWILDHPALLKNAWRALRPGGSIHWNFAGDGSSPALVAVLEDTISNPRYADFFMDYAWPWCMPSGDDYRILLNRFDFSRAEVSEEHIDRFFANADEMIRWIDQPCIVPFLARVPDDQKAAFRDDVVDEMLRRTKQPDGTYLEQFTRLYVTATK